VVLGLASDACLDPAYHIFSNAVQITAQLYRRTVSTFMNLRPLRPCWTIVRALSNRKSRHACDQAGSETGSVPQDLYHFGGPSSWFCRRSESLTNLRTPLTLNHQHRQTRHRKRHGSCQDLAVPAARCCARILTCRRENTENKCKKECGPGCGPLLSLFL